MTTCKSFLFAIALTMTFAAGAQAQSYDVGSDLQAQRSQMTAIYNGRNAVTAPATRPQSDYYGTTERLCGLDLATEWCHQSP